MTMQFGGGGGVGNFTTVPTAGHPTLQIGTGTFGGGAAPDFQGTSAIGLNMAAGYSGNLMDLQVNGVQQATINQNGALALRSPLTFTTSSPSISAPTGTYLAFVGGLTAVGLTTVTNIVFAAKGLALQTGDLFQAQDSGVVNHFGVANVGTGASPIWALRVAPVANAASMAQAHVGGASTGKAIQVIDNAGTTIGWLQLLA